MISLRCWHTYYEANLPIYNCKMAYQISSPSASSKPVIFLHCCELPSLTQVPQTKIYFKWHVWACYQQGFEHFLLKSNIECPSCKPKIGVSKHKDRVLLPPHPLGQLHSSWGCTLGTWFYFLSPSRNYSKQAAEILILYLINYFLQVQNTPGYPTHSPLFYLLP